MKIGSLCSGAGGLDMAVESVFAAETVWHCEINEAAAKVLAHRYPGVPNHRDIIATNWDEVEPVDIMAFGWPCQPFSLAGKQKGAEDERAIWPAIAGAIRILRPRFCVMENVSAVVGSELARVAADMATLGYDIRWTCLRAGDIGAPHRRERLFIIAHTKGERRGVLHTADLRATHREINTLADHRDTTPDTSGDRWNQRWTQPTRFIGGSDAAVSGDGPVALLPTPRTSDTNGAGTHGQGGLDLRTAVSLLPTPRSSRGSSSTETAYALGGDRSDDSRPQGEVLVNFNGWGKYAPAIHRWESATRLAPNPTEPNSKGKPRLSPAFSEWLMGWPAGWVTDVPGISRNDQLRIIGNGVVPQAAEVALRYLLQLEAAA